MDDSWRNVVCALVSRLERAMVEDGELRSDVRELSRRILRWLDEVDGGGGRPVRGGRREFSASSDSIARLADRAFQPSFRDETSHAREVPLPPACSPEGAEELALIEQRTQLKAEGARWAARRAELLRGGSDFTEDIEPVDRELIARAKALPDCFLWMNHSSGPEPISLNVWEDVAGCFDACAASVGLLRDLLAADALGHEVFETALDLAAEAQSQLRVLVNKLDGRTDSDQFKLYSWLRRTAHEQQILIQRYMRLSDPADPNQWADLVERIEQIRTDFEDDRHRDRTVSNLVGRVKYHVDQITQRAKDEVDDEDALDHDWERIEDAVEQLMDLGLPPSDRVLRETLLPVIETMPEDYDEGTAMQLVGREIDNYLDSREQESDEEPTTGGASPSREIAEVRRLLAGRSVVIIGGEMRPSAKSSLEGAFALRELVWLSTREHESITKFEPAVTRPEVSLVLLAIRWSSHSYGDVKDFCDRCSKPLVRLPAGYGVNQVAHQILLQASDQLATQKVS